MLFKKLLEKTMKSNVLVRGVLIVLASFFAITASADVVWEETYTNGVAGSGGQNASWAAFKNELVPGLGYQTMTISGTFDNPGLTCTDSVATAQFANLLNTTGTGSVNCDGHEWAICGRYNGEVWIDPPSICDGGNCPDPGRIIRPGLFNKNWGGMDTATCSGPTQTMRLEFDTTPSMTPSAPTINSIAPGNGQATVSFTPGEDNGSPITGYRYIKDDGTVTSTILGTTGSDPLGIAMDAAGNIYTANGDSDTVSKITPDGTSSILGTTGNRPKIIAIDAAGNIYTANRDSNTVSKITPDGTSSILGTTGSTPLGITIDGANNIYTANYNSDTVSKITPEGISTIFGTTGNNPKGIAIDAAGNIYTANSGSDTVSKITPEGISTILSATGSSPRAITVGAAGNIYTANSGSNTVSKITPDGIASILGTTGSSPRGIAMDAAGNIYTANESNNVSKITPYGISTIFGTTGSSPFGIAIDAAGNIYTANSGSDNVSKLIPASAVSYPAISDISPITITGLTNGTDYSISLIAVNDGGESVASSAITVTAGMPSAPTIDSIEPGNSQATVSFTPGEDNGSPITGYRYIKDNGFVSSPDFATTGSTAYGIAMDADGNVYTANSGSNNVSKVTPDGTTTTLGTTGAGPRGITVDADGNVYTSNLDDDTVSKIAPDGTSTIVGTTGLKPRAIAVDTAGNVYTANTDSDTVSKITPAGTSTIFGTTGNTPVAIAIDVNGNLYTANVDSDTVSKITAGGISTILGVTGSGPRDITVDADGNVYTANQDSDDVSKIAPDGTTITLATTGAGPRGIALDADGNIYTANRDADNVSKITPDGNSATLGATAFRPRGIAVDTDGNVYTSSTSSNTLSKITDTSTATFAATGDTSPITITGLTNDIEYLMSLIAVNDVGESAASNSVSVIPTPTAPDAPTIASVVAGDGEAIVTFTPGADNGSSITGYTALCGSGLSDFVTTNGPTSPITVSGLTNGVAAFCVVSATNDVGTGPASVLSAPFTPEVDTDGDGVNDLLDNCVSIANPDQTPSAINPNCGEACVTSGCAGTICENH